MKFVKGKELLLRTFVYILAVIVFFTYWSVLGVGTAFVGATVAKGSLVLLNKDLTANPIRSTLNILFLFIFIGVVSFVATFNLYTGLFINFFAIFFLTYNLVSNLKQSIWAAFVLGYLYLLIEPCTIHTLGPRLLGLAIGALFVMLTQFILNKNKSRDKLNNNISTLINEISLKLKDILDGKNPEDNKFKVSNTIDDIVSIVYNKRIDPYFIRGKDNIILNVSLYMERLDYLIKELNLDLTIDLNKSFILDLFNLMNVLSENINSNSNKDVILIKLNDFNEKYKEKASDNYYLYEILQNLSMLMLSFKNTSASNYSRKDMILNRKLRKRIHDFSKFKIDKNSIRFTYAFRFSLVLSLSYFISKRFNIPQGDWIMFTLFAVVQPFVSDSKKRFSKRFTGTLYGIVIFAITYFLVDSIIVKGIIFVAIYYIYVIATDYSIKTTCTTSVSLGLFAILTHDPSHGILYRFSFMGIGVIVGYLATRFIFPYSLKNSMIKLMENYNQLSKEILAFTFSHQTDKSFFNILNEKIFISKLYETKIVRNNTISEFKNIKEFIYNQRILNNTIYFFVFSLQNHNIDLDNKRLLEIKDDVYKISSTFSVENYNEDELLLLFKNLSKDKFKNLKTTSEKLAFINIYRILIRMEISNYLVKKIVVS